MGRKPDGRPDGLVSLSGLALEDVRRRAEELNERTRGRPLQDDEYIGEDGLVYCSRCHTPRQSVLTSIGLIQQHWCRCQEEDEMRRRAEEERRREYDRLQGVRANALFYEAERSWTFENSDGGNEGEMLAVKEELDGMYESMSRRCSGILLSGPSGCGKTYAAYCILNDAYERLHTAKGVPFWDMVSGVRRRGADGKYLERITAWEVLLIDGVSLRTGDADAATALAQVLDRRERMGYPIVVTTQMDMGAAERMADPSSPIHRAASMLNRICVEIRMGRRMRDA